MTVESSFGNLRADDNGIGLTCRAPFPARIASGNVHAMSDGKKIPEQVRLLAEQAGLGRALKLFPETVAAAAERGLRPLGEPPGGISPIASPAPVFDPTHFEGEE
jgi:hypothetical protein